MIVVDVDRIKHKMPSYRATGKTFNKLCLSMAYASAGDTIYYITLNQNQKHWTFQKLCEIMGIYFGGSFQKDNKKYTVSFPNGGNLILVSDTQWENQLRRRIVNVDGKSRDDKTQIVYDWYL